MYFFKNFTTGSEVYVVLFWKILDRPADHGVQL